MGTLNYSTGVASSVTAAEMSKLLSAHGASRVTVVFEPGASGRHIGLEFTLPTPHGPRVFALPIDVDAVHRLLEKQAKGKVIRKGFSNAEQAERTAWRVAKNWLAAQLAIIEAQMATLDEVMLPYLLGDDGRTLYAAYREHEDATLAITTGDGQ
jgi:hypothetical protein